MSQTDYSPQQVTLISATDGPKHYWRELWRFKELFFLLAWRDLLVRYKQTFIGVSWAVLRPLITVMVFTFVFGKIAKLPSGDTPYALFVFAAMLPWQFFSTALAEAGNSVVSNANLVTKIYFPRLLLPLSSILVCFVDALIAAILFIGLIIWYGVVPSWHIVFLPIFVLWLALVTLGLSLWIAALNVTYRDFRYLVPFMLQLGMYVSPVGFSSTIIPEKWLWLFYLNPLAGVIDGFRWTILGNDQQLNLMLIFPSLVFTLLLLVYGLIFFRSAEASFADGI
jgi:lipopolysaccharide transport system permease protein